MQRSCLRYCQYVTAAGIVIVEQSRRIQEVTPMGCTRYIEL